MAGLDRRAFVTGSILLLGAGCGRTAPASLASPAPSSSVAAPAPSPDSANAPSAGAGSASSTKLLTDEELGPLLTKLSENAGSFPSENYVTNETSLLHVAKLLKDPKLRGRAYVGVGPEQSYTYLALLEPKVAYVVDIRRGNFLEHMIFRGCFEAGATRVEFLSALLMRRPKGSAEAGVPDGTSFAPLHAAFRGVPASPALRDEGVARTKAVFDRLHIAHTASDDKTIARIHEAFSTNGLGIKYTMLDSGRAYPSLGDNFAATDTDSGATSFLGNEDTYQRVRRLVLENRVLPVVGDFGGTHALRAVAEDMRARNVPLGVFYTSNVEQYLFESKTHGNFVASVKAMPRDGESRLVRVWFDAGKPHPAQRAGHRTTQVSVAANAFVTRAEAKPFRYYWDVVNQPADPPAH